MSPSRPPLPSQSEPVTVFGSLWLLTGPVAGAASDLSGVGRGRADRAGGLTWGLLGIAVLPHHAAPSSPRSPLLPTQLPPPHTAPSSPPNHCLPMQPTLPHAPPSSRGPSLPGDMNLCPPSSSLQTGCGAAGLRVPQVSAPFPREHLVCLRGLELTFEGCRVLMVGPEAVSAGAWPGQVDAFGSPGAPSGEGWAAVHRCPSLQVPCSW